MPFANPEARSAYAKAYYQKHKEKYNALDKERYEKSKTLGLSWNKHLERETPEQKAVRLEKMRAYMLLRNFGLTLEQYRAMAEEQGGKCAICATVPKAKAGKHNKVASLAVDHCHKTGRVRRLLCAKCNMALGWYEKHQQTISAYLLHED